MWTFQRAIPREGAAERCAESRGIHRLQVAPALCKHRQPGRPCSDSEEGFFFFFLLHKKLNLVHTDSRTNCFFFVVILLLWTSVVSSINLIMLCCIVLLDARPFLPGKGKVLGLERECRENEQTSIDACLISRYKCDIPPPPNPPTPQKKITRRSSGFLNKFFAFFAHLSWKYVVCPRGD